MSCTNNCRGFAITNHFAAMSYQFVYDSHFALMGKRIYDFVLYLIIGMLACDSGRCKKYAVESWMYGVFDDKGNFAVNAATGKPSRIGKLRSVYKNTDNIFSIKSKLLCDIILERYIAIRALAEIIAVAPDTAVFINAVKGNGDSFAFPFPLGSDMDAIPCNPTGKVAGSAGCGFIKRKMNRPIMRKSNFTPVAVIHPSLMRIFFIT